MAVTFSWEIRQLIALPTHNEQNDVVCNVVWSYHGVDENGVKSVRSGSHALTYEEGAPFIPFSELTEDQVVSWIQALIAPEHVAQMQIEITKDIDWQIDQKNAIIPRPLLLPWQS